MEYTQLFRILFKKFSSRLADANPKMVQSQEKLDKYTIVSNVSYVTDIRPEVKDTMRVYTKDPDKPLIKI